MIVASVQVVAIVAPTRAAANLKSLIVIANAVAQTATVRMVSKVNVNVTAIVENANAILNKDFVHARFVFTSIKG